MTARLTETAVLDRSTNTEIADNIEMPAVQTRPNPTLADEADPGEPHANETSQEDLPPDGGYGWICTACVFLINAHTWGVSSVSCEVCSTRFSNQKLTYVQAWGIFLARYLSESTFPGASRLEYALIGGLSISQSCLLSPLVALSNDKLGTRATLLIGTALVSLSMLGASFATQIWHLFLSQGCCFGYGMSFLYVTAAAALPQWFSKRRSLAVGIASSGAGFGGLAYNLGAGAAVESIGLPWTYRLLALCTLTVNSTCSILLKDRNEIVKPRKDAFDFREYGHISVLLVILWGICTELGYIVLLYSLPNYAISIGLTARQGSVVAAVLNLGLALGRPAVGYLSDRLGRINMATAMTGLCGILCLAVWIPAKTYAVLLIFALLSGAVTGTFWGTVVPVITEVVGLQRLPSVFGLICLPLVLPTTFAEPIALEIVSTSGYLSTQIFVGCMFLAGAASTWALHSWKICDTELKQAHDQDEVSPDGRAVSTEKHQVWLTPRRLFSAQTI